MYNKLIHIIFCEELNLKSIVMLNFKIADYCGKFSILFEIDDYSILSDFSYFIMEICSDGLLLNISTPSILQIPL